MTQQIFSLVTAMLFSLIALLHAIRLARGWHVTIGDIVVPVGPSWLKSGLFAMALDASERSGKLSRFWLTSTIGRSQSSSSSTSPRGEPTELGAH